MCFTLEVKFLMSNQRQEQRIECAAGKVQMDVEHEHRGSDPSDKMNCFHTTPPNTCYV